MRPQDEPRLQRSGCEHFREILGRWFFARGWVRGLCSVQLPDDLTHYGGPHGGVAGGEIQAADEAADALVGVGDGAAIEEAAGAEGLGEDGGEAFDFGGVAGGDFSRARRNLAAALASRTSS